MWGYRQFTFVDIILNEKMPAWLSKEKCILRSRVVFPPTVGRLQFWVMRISLRSSTYSFQRSPTAYSVTISSHTSGAGSTQHPHSKPCIPEAILPVSKINLLCWLRSSQWQCQPMLYNSTVWGAESMMAGKAWWWKHEVAGHTASAVRKHRERNAGTRAKHPAHA